jgi:CRISPR-associated protein Csm5
MSSGIERTAHHPYTGIPYLPGSSVKGSARTAWLNDVDQDSVRPRDRERSPARDESTQLENNILGGSFSTDPFRLVEFADTTGASLKSQVVFAVDRRKRPRPDSKERDLAVRREVIAGGQLRAANGEVRFKVRPASSDPNNTPRADRCIGDFAALARACNRFYGSRLEVDLDVLANLGMPHWARAFKSLIAALKPDFDEGRAILLRVGRHSGAESATLDRHRWIRIMEGPGQEHWSRDATTIWLAAENQDSINELRPFGWLLVERTDNPLSGDHLKRWCGAEPEAFVRHTTPTPGAPSSRDPSHAIRPGAGASREPPASPQPGALQFRQGDLVRNAAGDEGTVVSDVRVGETEMMVQIDGDLYPERVAEWQRI